MPTEQPSAAKFGEPGSAPEPRSGSKGSRPTDSGTPEHPAASVDEPLRAEELRDAIGDILDICDGWTRHLTKEQRLEAIRAVASKAWEGERD